LDLGAVFIRRRAEVAIARQIKRDRRKGAKMVMFCPKLSPFFPFFFSNFLRSR